MYTSLRTCLDSDIRLTGTQRVPLVATMLLLGAFAFMPQQASAELVSLTCPGIQSTRYQPGLRNAPRSITLDAMAVSGPCVGLPASIVWLRSGGIGEGVLSCALIPFSPASGSTTLVWSDGTQSLAEQQSVVVDRPLGQVIVVITFKIVEGRFLNATVVQTLTLLQTQLLACGTAQGVTAVAGPVTTTVIGL